MGKFNRNKGKRIIPPIKKEAAVICKGELLDIFWINIPPPASKMLAKIHNKGGK